MWLVCSKLSTWLPASQLVYYSLMTAFYDTDFALGFILPRHLTGTSRVQEQSRRLALEFSSRQKPRLWPLLQYVKLQTASSFETTLFSTCTSGIVLNELSVTIVCQRRPKLHKTVTHSWINGLICIPCMWPEAIITFLRGRESCQSVQTYFSIPLAPPTGNKRKIRLAHETSNRSPSYLH